MHKLVLVLAALICTMSDVSAQSNSLFWSIRDDQTFGARHNLNGPNGTTVVSLSGRALVALLEAKRRIGEQYGLQPVLVITNQAGINAFATEVNGKSLVAVYADTVKAIGDDEDMWAALMGHEFGHVYHHHVANHQARASLINLAAAVLDGYQQKHGRQRTELINFGAQLIDNTFTREQEREADASSVEYMVQAGYNPEGAIRLQQLLISRYGTSGALAFLQSHPSGEERIQNLRDKIATARRSSSVDSSVSSVEFRRYITLCGGEAKEAEVDNSKMFATLYACLKKQNSEIAKRFAICTNDLSANKRLNLESLANCVAHTALDDNSFGYLPWASYCSVDARQQGGTETAMVGTMNKCIWSNVPSLALRGFLCEAEIAQLRVPNETRAAKLRTCSSETAELKTRFDRGLWDMACKRKGTTIAYVTSEQESVERDCLSAAPDKVGSSLGSNKSALTPQQILAEVKTAWSKQVPLLISGTPTECDRLASVVQIGDIKPHYVGFIDASAAEPACVAAVKNSKDNGRAMVNLAGVYFQQGRYAEASDFASKAKAKNALNAGTVLAVLYTGGYGGYVVDHAKSYSLLLQDAKLGSVEAMMDLAAGIQDGRGIEAQPEIAFELAKMAAEKGGAGAIAYMGSYYLSGKGVPQDKNEALRLFRQTAPEFPVALMGLIAALRNTPNSNKEELRQVQNRAFEVAKRYSEIGSLYARSILATIYANGLGVTVDRAKAAELYKELADYQIVSAYMALGFAYLNGAGVAQDKDQAISYFKKAAAQGNKEAEVQIARILPKQ